MFFEGAFAATGFGFDYDDFSIRIAEAEQHTMVERQNCGLRTYAADVIVVLVHSRVTE
jgi:hypothetical protein